MNSMHNSFTGPGGYSGTYPGYVPPPTTSLPYYNGYPGEVTQSVNHYYCKPPGYSSGVPPYTQHSSMYYQQYGLGCQHPYGKYGISSSLGYSSEIHPNPGFHTPSVGGLQAPTTDLGLTGSMFSKNNKISATQNNSSHAVGLGSSTSNSNILTSAAKTPSPGLHSATTNVKRPGTTSPPSDSNEGKKDIEKMKRCQICGQVFLLMSECLNHMKTVHEAPLSGYNTSHMNQAAGLPSHSISPASRHTSLAVSDSPLMALERMGWGEKQHLMQLSSPLSASYTTTTNSSHILPVQHSLYQTSASHPTTSTNIYGTTSQQHPLSALNQPMAQHSTLQHLSSHSENSNQSFDSKSIPTDYYTHSVTVTTEIPSNSSNEEGISAKQRRSHSYSVSSIIGESHSIGKANNCPLPEITENSEEKVSNLESRVMQFSAPGVNDCTEYDKMEENNGYPQSSVSDGVNEKLIQEDEKNDYHKDKADISNKSPQFVEEVKDDEEFMNESQSADFAPTTLIVGKKDLLREMQSSFHYSSDFKEKHFDQVEEGGSSMGEGVDYSTIGTEVVENDYITIGTEVVENENLADLKNDIKPSDSKQPNSEESLSSLNQSPLPPNQQDYPTQQVEQPSSSSQACQHQTMHPVSISQQSTQQHQPQPAPAGVYQSQTHMKSQAGFCGWTAPMTGYGYSGGPGTPNPVQQQVPKPGGYPPVQPRFPHYQPGNQSSPYPHPHEHQVRPQSQPQGGWFPPRNDPKVIWNSWSGHSGLPYPQGYYAYPNTMQQQGQKYPPHPSSSSSGAPQAHMHPHTSHLQQQTQKSAVYSSSGPYPPTYSRPINLQKDNSSPTASMGQPISSGENSQDSSDRAQAISGNYNDKYCRKGDPSVVGTPEFSKHLEDISCPSAKYQKFGKSIYKVGPKSKTLATKQSDLIDDVETYKCTISVQENGSLNGYFSQESNGTCGPPSCESSDSEMAADDVPIFTLLRPAKRKYGTVGTDGIFVGPKRVKLAKQIQERQQRRRKSLQEQMRQSELEEQIQAQRIEFAVEQNGPLANVLLQSSILLSDKKVEESDIVDECIAKMKAAHHSEPTLEVLEVSLLEDCSKPFSASIFNSMLRKSGRRSNIKVFHNDSSVIIRAGLVLSPPVRKLRSKDFKWSHYLKSMRYWCNDCAHGFKNQKEAVSHSEDRCKWTCLYMLECYVTVIDIQTHPLYGSKVQELLEEYQIDGDHHCNTCYELIPRKADYLVHVDSHKDFMPWECTICGTRFKIRGSLKEHLRYTHMKGRVPCLKCNKVFPTSTLLRQHVKVHTQHYKYKSAKNREEELRAAMEATAEALECPIGGTTPEDREKLSQEASEYRSWCRLMEMNALRNLTTSGTLGGSSAGGSLVDEEEEDMDGSASGDEGAGIGGSASGENSCSEIPKNYFLKSEMNS